jgi:hypothetical protein
MIDLNLNPSRRELKWFAVLEVLFFAVVAGLVYRRTGSLTVPTIIISVSAAVGLIGFVFPKFMHWVYVGWMLAAFPIGWCISHLVMLAIFFFVVTPVGLLMRLMGRDPMQRLFDRSAKSYWIARNGKRATQDYFRQF